MYESQSDQKPLVVPRWTWSYPGKATIMKHNLPKISKEEEMENNNLKFKQHIYF